MHVDFHSFHKVAIKRMWGAVPVGILIRKLQRLRLKVGFFEARYFCNKYVSLFKIVVCYIRFGTLFNHRKIAHQIHCNIKDLDTEKNFEKKSEEVF